MFPFLSYVIVVAPFVINRFWSSCVRFTVME
jgi:hypothetical protein